tara:strand:+ start:326 stop:556 length:231 start_codon:yes stop_codon:yes gene_type:complete
MKYKKGDLVVLRGRALSKHDNAFFVGVIVEDCTRRYTRQYDDLWNTKELIWEKVYKVMTQGKIIKVNFYDIKGRAK